MYLRRLVFEMLSLPICSNSCMWCLEEKINSLSKEEKLVAALACEKTCSLLWNALTGIMEHTGAQCLN